MRSKLAPNQATTRTPLKAIEGPVKAAAHPNVPYFRRRSLAALPATASISSSDVRADTPSGEGIINSPRQVRKNNKQHRRSVSTSIPSKGILLSPLSEAPASVELSVDPTPPPLLMDAAIISAGLPAFFPLCRRSSPTGSTSEDNRSTSSTSSGAGSDVCDATKGLVMRSGGPKSLPPLLQLGRPRSRSMDHDNQDPDNSDVPDRRRSYSSVTPLFGITPRDVKISTSLGNEACPVSILKNSQERLHKVIAQPSPPRLRKVSFKGLANPECINDSISEVTNPDSSDSGNEADLMPKNDKDKQTADDNKGFCTVVHSFTPRRKPRKPVRPPTPILMDGYADSEDEGEEEGEEEDTNEDNISDEDKINCNDKRFSMSKLKSLEPKLPQTVRTGRLSAASTSSSSSSSTISTRTNKRPPFK